MRTSKKVRNSFLLYVLPILCAGLLNTIWPPTPELKIIHFGVLSSLILECVYLQWCFSAQRRFPQKQMRRSITLFVASFMLLGILSVAKYNFTFSGSTTARYLWYAYYVPFTFAPTFMLRASLCFGKADDYRLPKKWGLLFLPPALLSAGILSNDFHQLAFAFPNGFDAWEQDYTHGAVYSLALVWIALTVLCIFVLVIRSAFSRRLFKTAWLPALVAAGAVLYYIMYALPGNHPVFQLLHKMYQLSNFTCIAGIALWESFIFARLVVSNRDYPSIFAASSLNAGLADNSYQVKKISDRGVHPQPEQLQQAAKSDGLLLPDGDTLLKVQPVQGGWFYWIEHIAELHRMQKELEETADYLNEENAMMRLSAEIDEGRRAMMLKTQLYDRVTKSLHPQLEQLNTLLEHPPEDETAFRNMLKVCSVLLAYAKRRSYLLLEASQTPIFEKEELSLCLEESVRALRLADVDCSFTAQPGLPVAADDAVKLYEAFESAVEAALPALSSLAVSLTQDSGRTTLMLDAASMTEETTSAMQAAFVEADRHLDGADAGFVLHINNREVVAS